MANTKSAAKAARQANKRQAINDARKSAVRTAVRKVEEAVAKGDAKTAAAAMKLAEPQLRRAGGKGVVSKNAVSRKVSRLTKKIKAISK
jgi:small subunit ribosomal protein S20